MKLLPEFYDFMKERELIRLRRRAGLPREQWTQDEIFRQYSFTNIKREHDRFSQFAKRWYHRWFGSHDEDHREDLQNSAELLLNCAIVRYFGTPQSVETLGYFSWASTDAPDGNWDEYLDRLDHTGMCGDLTFTSAYVVPNCGDPSPKYQVVAKILHGIKEVSEDVILALHRDGGSWAEATRILSTCFGCGSFMSKEILLDYLMATGFKPEDWTTWTPVGPGGCRGAGWVKYGFKEKLPEYEALNTIRKIYAEHPIYWPERWTEFGEAVRLDLTDIQFQLCEFSKYQVAKTDTGRPKRKFKPIIDAVTRGDL